MYAGERPISDRRTGRCRSRCRSRCRCRCRCRCRRRCGCGWCENDCVGTLHRGGSAPALEEEKGGPARRRRSSVSRSQGCCRRGLRCSDSQIKNVLSTCCLGMFVSGLEWEQECNVERRPSVRRAPVSQAFLVLGIVFLFAVDPSFAAPTLA